MPKPPPKPPTVIGPGPLMPATLWPLVGALAGLIAVGLLVGGVLQACR